MTQEAPKVLISKTSLEILLQESQRLRQLYDHCGAVLLEIIGPNRLKNGSIDWSKLAHNQAVREAEEILKAGPVEAAPS